MSKRTGTALVLVMLASTTPAFAHSPIMGIGGVVGGILHALLIPEHGLSLLGARPRPRAAGAVRAPHRHSDLRGSPWHAALSQPPSPSEKRSRPTCC